MSLALVVSLATERQYTATARIVIEPPAGSDPRGSIAISPIYLESLRTYEQFAESDSLFESAAARFGLRNTLGSRPIEAIKKRVLKVALVRNTRILEISATLPDPAKAQALAHLLADSAVALNRSTASEGDRDLVQGVQRSRDDARARLEEIDRNWARLMAQEPVEELQTAMSSAARLREALTQETLAAELEIADNADRVTRAAGEEAAEIRRQQASAQVRLQELRKRMAGVDLEQVRREKLLAERTVHRDAMGAARKAAQDALAAAEGRLRAAQAEEGYRGERLTVIDPGVVPERPSSPNLPLNLGAALLLGFVLPVLYLVFEMNYREQRAGGGRSRFQALERAFDP